MAESGSRGGAKHGADNQELPRTARYSPVEGPASVDSFDRYLVQTGDVRGSLILATDANASEPFTILTGVTSFGLPNARRMTSQEPEPRAIFSRALHPFQQRLANAESGMICRPCESKLLGSSQVSKASLIAGHL